MAVSRKLGITGAVVLFLALAAVLWFSPRGPALTAFGDICPLVMMVAATVAMLRNALVQERARAFWMLLGFGCLLWSVNQGFWTYYEVVLKRDLPDPSFGDVILFIHIVPFMAAVALRPHRPRQDRKVLLDTVNFLMLLVWWVFLYMFVVFPDEYVMLNVPVYSRNYDTLYLLENFVLVFALGTVAYATRGNWRKIYWNLFVASALYTLASEIIDAAITRNHYYTGSPYDLLLLLAIAWMLWTAILARHIDLNESPDEKPASRWVDLAPRLAMIAILSLPLVGLWTLYFQKGPAHLRNFRLLVTMAATLVLGLFVFFKQFILDRQLISLLDQSRRSFESLQRLQTHLVQKEKLASLGQLVAGAAHEINNPLAAILGYSELLAAQTSLHGEQASMAQKIGQQARRTRDLVADLLSFSQQNPSEKVLVDVSSLAQRALQMHEVPAHSRNIRVEADLQPGLPRVWGNTNQLLQCFLHITENAIDALGDVGGGILAVKSRQEKHELVVEFSDSGPGMSDPQRVFDPFYTTKPIGKGTGLGLSATYGVVQDHQGTISCHNKPEGGALFVLRFPVASQAAAAVEAGKA
jgi:signal transduction histidine kinase